MIDRALVVGLGSIGARHLRLLRDRLPEADIRVLRSRGGAAPVALADGCFDALDAACAFRPDIAVIASPAPFHIDAARALALAGAHLLVEKPISDRLDGVADLVALCESHGRQLFVGYNLRQLDTLKRFRDEVRAGRIGSVLSVRAEVGQHLPGWRPDTDYRETVSAQRALGGGVLLELSHELDLLRWVFGDVDWVSAWTGRISRLEIDVEDTALITLGFGSGPIAQVNLDFVRRDTTRVCTAIGSVGSLSWDAVAGRVSLFEASTGASRVLLECRPERDATYRTQLDVFLAGIAQPGKPLDTDGVTALGTDGLAALRLIEAARTSAAQDGRRVGVASVDLARKAVPPGGQNAE